MNSSLQHILGISAGVLSFLAFVPYILATLRGSNRPNRATWIIWTVLGFILLGSYKAAGATDTLWLTVGNVIAFSAVVILSFKYGEGGWEVLDMVCLTLAALGIFLWWYYSSPLLALYLSVVLDFVGAIPTLKKTYEDPESENLLSWIIFWIANTVNLFALHEWTMAMAFYPLYMFGITGLLVFVILFSKKRLGQK